MSLPVADETVFADLPRSVIDASGNVIYLLDSALRIAYCNPAWDAFALANDGRSSLASLVLGKHVFDFTAEPLREFYARVFRDAASQSLPVSFDFECSSPDVRRLMRMDVHYLPSSRGFAFISALRQEQAHSGEICPEDPALYLSPAGLIAMCCHCRRARRVAHPALWDWVPQYVRRMPPNVTHAICPTCMAYFYPPVAQSATR